MFKLSKKISPVTWPIQVHKPVDGGKTEEHEFNGKFNLLGQEEYDELMASGKSDFEIMKVLMVGWEDLNDDDNKPVEFNNENLKMLIRLPYVKRAVFSAYHQAVSGIAVKN